MTSIEAIVNRQILKWELESQAAEQGDAADAGRPAIITISRQTGSRGSYFGSRLAQRLGYQRFQRAAIDLIGEAPVYYNRIAKALGDSFRKGLKALAESKISGSGRGDTGYAVRLCQVVLSMSELGGVVAIGRGASWIIGPERGFHLRIVGPREKRIENLIKYKQMTAEEAAEVIDQSDASRRKFIANTFGGDIDAPQHYDMTVNSALIDVEEMVDIATTAIEAKTSKLAFLSHDQI